MGDVSRSTPTQSKSSDVDSANKTRHCGFCLEICGVPAKLCGGCKKRAYCSRECQVADWKITEPGQRHKNWCGRYEHGEEDVDWEVVPIPNKGLGVRAKRLIPVGSRIIVEPVFTDPLSHPGIKDLEPKEASLEEKFKFNAFQGHPKLDGGKPFLSLRSSRLNHDCMPNAGTSCDYCARVQIIYSLRDIQPGEEICICYYNHLGLALEPDSNFMRVSHLPRRSPNPKEEFKLSLLQQGFHQQEVDYMCNVMTLKTVWGIICPDNCFCKRPGTQKLILETKKLYDQMRNSSTLKVQIEAGVKMLDIYEVLGISWVQKADVLHKLSEMDKHTAGLDGMMKAWNASPRVHSRKQQHCIKALQIRRIISPFVCISPDLEVFLKMIDAEK